MKKKSGNQKLDLTVLICQTDCKVGKTVENIKRWAKKLEKYSEKDEIDIVMFLEMAFSGYVFDSLAEISPCLEVMGKGINF